MPQPIDPARCLHVFYSLWRAPRMFSFIEKERVLWHCLEDARTYATSKGFAGIRVRAWTPAHAQDEDLTRDAVGRFV